MISMLLGVLPSLHEVVLKGLVALEIGIRERGPDGCLAVRMDMAGRTLHGEGPVARRGRVNTTGILRSSRSSILRLLGNRGYEFLPGRYYSPFRHGRCRRGSRVQGRIFSFADSASFSSFAPPGPLRPT